MDTTNQSKKTSPMGSVIQNPDPQDCLKEELPFLMQKMDNNMEEEEYFEEDSSLDSESLQIQSNSHNSVELKSARRVELMI